MPEPMPTILIIVGISGDLSKRKLLPAISELSTAGVLPKNLRIVGITRRSDVEIETLIKAAADQEYLRNHLELFQMDLESPDGYKHLCVRLDEIEADFGHPAQRLYYLSVPPQVSHPIIEQLGASGLAGHPHTKLLLEKPFGVDLASAESLIQHIDSHFSSDQVYRIDHYLAKEMAQNIIVFREGNSLFKRTWNKEFIERIDIVASESIGIEGRGNFYESTGALRDLIQSHMLQLAALTLMDTPRADHLDEVPQRRYDALRQLQIPTTHDVLHYAKRGQYSGYAEQVENPRSTTETFVSLELESTDPTWRGVPIRLLTGKSMKEKVTEIRVTYRRQEDYESNQLILRLQPNEGIEICIWTKSPELERKIERHPIKFAYDEHFDSLPEAYERVFLDAINSDHTLFTTSQEVLASWHILAPVQHAWSLSNDDIINYKPGEAINTIVLPLEPRG
jgi:glucose-6-phosphate 1-dehydrogenase